MALTPAIVVLTDDALPLAERAAGATGGAVERPEGPVIDAIADLFCAGRPVIGLCAAGILIRAVAPFLADKHAEPPVIAVAEGGRAVVPLLGGHRGANDLAERIAGVLGVTPALTTAGEARLGVALDAPPPGWRVQNPAAAKPAMAALLAGRGAAVRGTAPWDLPKGDVPIVADAGRDVPDGALALRPQRFVLGLGAARGCPEAQIAALAEDVLRAADVAPAALAAIATVGLKADEGAILALARRWDVPLRLFEPAELEAETPRTRTPSKIVFAEIGAHGVAENAALASAGTGAQLAVPKRKSAMATAALAEAPAPIAAPGGRPRGQLAIVGIGPGQSAWRTPEASRLIAAADDLVGYSLYLDLIGPLAKGAARHDFALGDEAVRCAHALELAGRGRRVALISSGDAGIYAMGALVHELLDRGAVSDAAGRVEVVTAPGISALQAAAARAGAPLGHDFCAISLSDLLTPRDDIVRRIRAAAEGDFVIAFYNPVSKRRRTLLAEARETLLRCRPADCPVILAVSLGRPEERLEHRRLADLDVDEVDMLTTVIVGSSHTRVYRRGDGPAVYTPRGYARKMETP